MARASLTLLALILLGCGYRPLNQAPPVVEALRLGAFVDRTGEGDMGLRAARALRAQLRPHLDPAAAATLLGEVQVIEGGVSARLAGGPMERRLTVILRARLLEEGQLRWLGEARREVYTPSGLMEGHQRRRLALGRAVDEAAREISLSLRR